nr:immunoglobulin heavy chain junction region [Macaca mulatta]MOW21046.1 immunoglobulin heavy chain junction region [Macaca mulatta]
CATGGVVVISGFDYW